LKFVTQTCVHYNSTTKEGRRTKLCATVSSGQTTLVLQFK